MDVDAPAPLSAEAPPSARWRFRFPPSSGNLIRGEDCRGRLMRNVLLKVRPWSPLAFLLALLAIALAASIQEMFVIFGTRLYFASFFPAILFASLVAGAPAGVFATLLAVPIVWWAFMPPYFEFQPLTSDDYHRFAMFALGSALMISFGNLYREALALFRK